jgi:hypothetical protein
VLHIGFDMVLRPVGGAEIGPEASYLNGIPGCEGYRCDLSTLKSLTQSSDFFCEEFFEAIAKNMETFLWPIRIRMMCLAVHRIEN